MKSSYLLISKSVFYTLMAAILVAFAVGMFAGSTEVYEMVSDKGEVTGSVEYPGMISVVICLCYAMVAITLLLVLAFGAVSFTRKLMQDSRGALKSMLGVLLLAVLVGVACLMSSSDPISVEGKLLADSDGNPISGSSYYLTDVMIYMQYVLLAIAVLSMFASFVISKFRSR